MTADRTVGSVGGTEPSDPTRPPPPSGKKDHSDEAGKLTTLERKVIRDLGQVWNDLCNIVGVDVTREGDLAELVVHIHALQRAVMSNAAARRYPSEFRLLGGRIEP